MGAVRPLGGREGLLGTSPGPQTDAGQAFHAFGDMWDYGYGPDRAITTAPFSDRRHLLVTSIPAGARYG